MGPCPQCGNQNAVEAKFCSQCGTGLVGPAPNAPAPAAPTAAASDSALAEQEQVWRQFIGLKADYYLRKFTKFTAPEGPKFALTWNWPAFVFEPFLWFLYRKMYLYALVYAIGPVLAFYFTQDWSADLVWRIMAGASANYLYFWHIKEQLADIRRQAGFDNALRDRLIRDAGGVQAYVVWVGVGLLMLKFALVLFMMQQSRAGEGGFPIPKSSGAPARSVSLFRASPMQDSGQAELPWGNG
ncbi:MAG: DUF2628 domain-containing protein [Nitrospiraceae bacterium]